MESHYFGLARGMLFSFLLSIYIMGLKFSPSGKTFRQLHNFKYRKKFLESKL